VALLPGSRRNEFEALYGVSCEGIRIAREKGLNIRALVSVIEGVPAGYDIGIRHLMDNTLSEGEDLYDYLTRHKINPEDPKLAETSRRHVLVDPDANDLPATTAPHSRLLPSLADFSVVKSGTSTLEAGLAGKPMCVVYKAGTISYAIAHLVVNIPVFSLVNIVLGRYAVPELLQSEVNPARIAQEIERGLTDEKYREQQKAALAELPKKLGGPGASARAAKGIVDFLKGRA
jgi:lipid A disaccharide synthetase